MGTAKQPSITLSEQRTIIEALIENHMREWDGAFTSEEKKDLRELLQVEFIECVDDPALRAFYQKMGWNPDM